MTPAKTRFTSLHCSSHLRSVTMHQPSTASSNSNVEGTDSTVKKNLYYAHSWYHTHLAQQYPTSYLFHRHFVLPNTLTCQSIPIGPHSSHFSLARFGFSDPPASAIPIIHTLYPPTPPHPLEFNQSSSLRCPGVRDSSDALQSSRRGSCRAGRDSRRT